MLVRLYATKSIPIIRMCGVAGMVFVARLDVLPVGGGLSRSFPTIALLLPLPMSTLPALPQSSPSSLSSYVGNSGT